ncbi:MAG: hypothetical protein DRO99_02955 [Candidatus Aenigmatarchaeota archaeon]|nr:MAG: hypothetical protein DRO99_02955 [Candidatus Aenigmarchaeota archaeon]
MITVFVLLVIVAAASIVAYQNPFTGMSIRYYGNDSLNGPILSPDNASEEGKTDLVAGIPVLAGNKTPPINATDGGNESADEEQEPPIAMNMAGGGGSGGASGTQCTTLWECTEWSECSENGIMTRACTDRNACGTDYAKPCEEMICTYDERDYCSIMVIPDNIHVNMSKNSTFHASVYVDTSMQLYGAEFGLSYDNNTLLVEDLSGGGFFSKDGASTYSLASHANGTIFFAVSRMATNQSVSGSGTVAVITFTPRSSGNSQLVLHNITIAGHGLEVVQCNSTGSVVMVE